MGISLTNSENQTKITKWTCGILASGLLIVLAACTLSRDQTQPPVTPTAVVTQVPDFESGSQSIPTSIRFSKIGADEGFPQSTTYAIVQDESGFMWFGTEDGLNRYDGLNFTIFQPQNDDPTSLSDRWITSLVSAGGGDLWVGTRQGGVNYYHGQTGTFDQFLHDDSDTDSLNSNLVNVVFLDRSQRLWVGTNEGVDLFDADTRKFKHYYLDEINPRPSSTISITAFYEDLQGNLWVGTQKSGLFKLVPSTGSFTQFQPDSANLNSISSENVRAILPAGDISLWIATDKGLNLFIPSEEKFIRYEHSESQEDSIADNLVRTIYLDDSGILWLGTPAGLDCFDVKKNRFIHFNHDPMDIKSLSNNSVLAIYQSDDGVLWVSTYGGYINKYYRGMDRFAYYHYSTQNPWSIGGNIIFKIFTGKDNYVWVATVDGGLSRLDPATGHFKVYQYSDNETGSLSSDEVWSVFKDSAGTLWVGTRAGLDRLDAGEQEFIYYPRGETYTGVSVNGLVYDMAEDQSGNLWFGTSSGLDRYNRTEDRFTHFAHDPADPNSLSDSMVTKVYLDHSQILWLGTFSRGLNRYDPITNQFIRYLNDPENPSSISNDTVLSIFQDHADRVWIGTDGGGLNLMDTTNNTFSAYTEKDGLPSNVIYGILEDEQGNLWLSTNKGISRFNPDTGDFSNFGESDGLQGNEFNMNAYAKAQDGTLYFGGVNGLTAFKPEQITASTFIPPVKLLSVTQNGLPMEFGQNSKNQPQILLKWPYNSFEFTFAALSYADPKKNQHAYQLDGFDEDWINAGSWREGRYTNLPGGTYTLRLKGSNEDGIWNEQGDYLIVKVIPALWQRLWFQIGTVVLLFATILLVFRLRNAGIQANTKKLEQQVNERTKEIERLFTKTKELAVVEERNRLARELHDSAKQKAFAALAQLGTANGVLPDAPESAKSHLQEAENLVYEVIEELTFLIQEMYPLALKEKGLATSLREYVFDWEARTDIQVQMSIENDRRVQLDVEQAVYRAIQEALSNIARHSKATFVKIKLDYSDTQIAATIEDNGCGFNPDSRQTGMGLRTIRERMETLGGSMQIQSVVNKGTNLMLIAPIKTGQGEEQ